MPLIDSKTTNYSLLPIVSSCSLVPKNAVVTN